MQPNITSAEENYLKSIYHLQQHSGIVNTNALAQQLSARPASVTDMLKKLQGKKLVNYERYKGFYLSREGNKAALVIIRKHRLWELFLVSKLGFGWDEVHEVAEQLEHITSKKLVDKLDEFLGYPRFDPHGDPIPDNQGKIASRHQVKLSEFEVNEPAEITSVASQASELLEFLGKKSICIGTKLEIKRRFAFDKSVEIKIRNHAAITISEQIASIINVKPV